MEKLENVKKK